MIIKDGIQYGEISDNELAVLGLSLRSFLKVVRIPEYVDGKQVVQIAAKAFEQEDVLQEVYLPKTVKLIGERAFSACTNLEIFESEAFELSIERYAFSECESLERFFTRGRTILLGIRVFEYCDYIRKFDTIFYGKILERTFLGCWGLTTFCFEEVTFVDSDAFATCVALKNVIIKEDFQYDSSFKSVLKNVKIQCSECSIFVELAYEGFKINIIGR